MLTAIIVLSIAVLYLLVNTAVLGYLYVKRGETLRNAILTICKNSDPSTTQYVVGSDLLKLVNKKMKELEFIKK